MAQRQRVQYPQRMNQPLIGHVGPGAFFDWNHAGQHIAVRQNNSLGVARCAGSEQNLQRSFFREPGDRAHLRRGQLAHAKSSKARAAARRRVTRRAQLRQKHCIAKNKLRACVLGHAPYKIGGSEYVQRHRQHAAQHAAVKSARSTPRCFHPRSERGRPRRCLARQAAPQIARQASPARHTSLRAAGFPGNAPPRYRGRGGENRRSVQQDGRA